MLSNEDIFNICKAKNIKLDDILCKNELQNKKDGNYIINLSSSRDDGTHWTACVKNNDENFYFDSFGIIAPTEVENFLNNDYTYNDKQIQNYYDEHCGFYCIAFLCSMDMTKDKLHNMESFLNLFQDDGHAVNLHILENFIKEYIS